MRVMLPLAFWMLPAMALGGTPAPTRTPAEELDAELAAQVKIPEPELVIVTDGPDPARFDLLDGAVELDGRALPGPVQAGWGQEFFRGTVVPGNHVLTAVLAYRGSKTGAYPWSGSYAYRVPGKVEFQAQRGLRLVVHLRVEVREEQEDPRNRLAFRAALEPEMTAKVDDTPVPPPPRRVTPTEVFKPELAPALASVPENPPPPPPPAKTKKKTPKPKKKTSVAAASTPSLDVATARLQQAIAQPSPPPAASPSKSSGKSKKSDSGTP